MKKIVLLITLIAFWMSVAFVAQIDDNLSAESSRLLAKTETVGESDAYFYLLGFDANENDSPLEVGRAVFEAYRKLQADAFYEAPVYDESAKISLPEGELFCPFREGHCLTDLFNSDINIENLLKEHEVLMSRLNEFYGFSEFQTVNEPSFSAPIPPFRYISNAERIRLFSAIYLHQQGKSVDAMLALENQISNMRHSLALQDDLIGKLIFITKISEAMDVLSIISFESLLPVKKMNGLSQDEKSLGAISAREFRLVHNVMKDLDKNPDAFEEGGKLPGWIFRIIYKPNMTINAIEPLFSRLEKISFISPSQFASEIEKGERVSLSTSLVRNFAGNILLGLSSDYDKYVANIMDFEAKIVLFNHINTEFDLAVNPYYENEKPEVFENKVCFRGPMEDTRFLRCLRTKI